MSNHIDFADDTQSLHNIGEFILSYQPYQNAFLSALVNRIGRTILTSKQWNNPWAIFKQGTLEMGETIEEIFVNLAHPKSFDPGKAESEFMKREIPDVRAAFHTMNYQKFYKVTVSQDQLRQAFLSWQGITDLVAKIVESLYTGMNYDEFITMKYMMCREALNGGLFVYTTNEKSVANMKSIVTDFRSTSNQLEFLSTKYNRANVSNATPRNEQYLIIDTKMEAMSDVEVLASAFNMNKAEFLGHLIIIDSFSEHDNARLSELFGNDGAYTEFTGTEILALQKMNGILTDKQWWMVFDNLQQMTENYNGQGLYWQYYLHTWKTFSVSPFANAIAFTSQSSEITSVTVSPNAANVIQGGDMVFTATVSGTGLVKKSVAWSISGATKSGTSINPENGRLHVAKDEPVNTQITVTATAVDGQTGTATVYVTAVVGGVDSVAISPTSAEVAPGGTKAFTKTVTGHGTYSSDVIWSVEAAGTGEIASGTSISNGTLTVASAQEDDLLVRVVSAVDDSKYAVATVSISE